MPKSVLNDKDRKKIVSLIDKKGKTLSEVAEMYKVSPSTISRVLKREGYEIDYRVSTRKTLDSKTKLQLRKTLLGFGIPNPDILISEIDKQFEIKVRETQSEFIIINV